MAAANRAMAAELHISINAVQAHIRALFETFDLGRRSQRDGEAAQPRVLGVPTRTLGWVDGAAAAA